VSVPVKCVACDDTGLAQLEITTSTAGDKQVYTVPCPQCCRYPSHSDRLAALQSALTAREGEVAGLRAERDALLKEVSWRSHVTVEQQARAEAAEARALALETLLREARKTYIPVPNPTSVRVARLPHRMDFIARVDAALTPTTTGENEHE
jgi:hypothetical protein